jgi:hypothetical protein
VINPLRNTGAAVGTSPLAVAAAEAVPAHAADELCATLRHARIPAARAREFWEQALALAQEFARLPRGGDTTYGFTIGLYPTDHPRLPDQADASVR